MAAFVSIDGIVLPGHEARVSVFDTGFTFGDAVYETLRTYGGQPCAFERHLRRLRRSAARVAIELPISDSEFRARLDSVLAQARNPESYLRWIVSRGVGDISYNFDRVHGPTVVIVAREHQPLSPALYETGIQVALVTVRRNAPQALDPAIKSCNLLNNILAIREAQSRGALEAVMLNERGEVAEGAGSNVFMVKDGQTFTPPLDAGILPGITREILLELGPALGLPVDERRMSVADLLEADEVFMTSSLKEIAPVRAIDEHVVADGRPGPITLRWLGAYREFVMGART